MGGFIRFQGKGAQSMDERLREKLAIYRELEAIYRELELDLNGGK